MGKDFTSYTTFPFQTLDFDNQIRSYYRMYSIGERDTVFRVSLTRKEGVGNYNKFWH